MIGKLIVFEGVEGCGKTTQLTHLCTWLQESDLLNQLRSRCGIQGVLATREPGGTQLGQALRQLLLLPPGEISLADRAELLLYAADRAQHVEETIRPALAAGYLVICDRYTASTVAYQGYGRQLDLQLIETLNQIATGGLQSDLTLWLRLEAAAGLARLPKRGQIDRIERSGLAFHQRVQQGFEMLAQQQAECFIAVDGSENESAIAAKIRTLVSQTLQQWYLLPSQP
ncbi:MAG: dTMP kinase [Leptolyngbya sp. SIO4C1]|nr:dTMP kinase [Leptolyngbya sp. SIO4C1]